MKELYIIRHGETELNRQSIVQGGGVDAPLNETGRQQARAFYDHYYHVPFEGILTSKLQRTHQTISPFLEDNLPHHTFPELNEMGWGSHEGKKSSPAMVAEYQDALERWRNGNFNHSVGGGESIQQVADRLHLFFEQLNQREESLLLICAHGRTMRIMMTLLSGLSLREMEKFHHSNTGLYHLNYRNVGDVDFHLIDDTQHLALNRVP